MAFDKYLLNTYLFSKLYYQSQNYISKMYYPAADIYLIRMKSSTVLIEYNLNNYGPQGWSGSSVPNHFHDTVFQLGFWVKAACNFSLCKLF